MSFVVEKNKKLAFRLFKNKKFRILIIILIVCILAGWLLYARYTQVMPQPTIFLLNDVVLPKQGQKVVIFSPHPDDETIGAGGYIVQSIKNGSTVYIVLVTDGNKHGLEKKRYEEFEKATYILGIPKENLVFLNYPDGKLQKENENDLLQNFKIWINKFSPDIIIYPDKNDHHPDHFTTSKVVEEILKQNKQKINSYQYLVHHPRFPQPQKFDPSLFLLPPISMINFNKEWQRLILNQEIEDQKNEAVLSYKTQLKEIIPRQLLLSLIRKNELFSIEKNGN